MFAKYSEILMFKLIKDNVYKRVLIQIIYYCERGYAYNVIENRWSTKQHEMKIVPNWVIDLLFRLVPFYYTTIPTFKKKTGVLIPKYISLKQTCFFADVK
ncbi:hypothetical protein ACJX0J_013737 [Zea mays]